MKSQLKIFVSPFAPKMTAKKTSFLTLHQLWSRQVMGTSLLGSGGRDALRMLAAKSARVLAPQN